MVPVRGGGRAAASAVLVLGVVSATVLVGLVRLRVKARTVCRAPTGKKSLSDNKENSLRDVIKEFIFIINSNLSESFLYYKLTRTIGRIEGERDRERERSLGQLTRVLTCAVDSKCSARPLGD
jgi:hypothetical protein